MCVCVCVCELYIECNVLYAVSETRRTYDTDISYLTEVSRLVSRLMFMTLLLLCLRCYCVFNLTPNQFVSLFVLNWQFLFNMFRVQTYCLYKLLWLCIAYWMGRVNWIIKVVHFLYRRMFPFGFLYELEIKWRRSLLILKLIFIYVLSPPPFPAFLWDCVGKNKTWTKNIDQKYKNIFSHL